MLESSNLRELVESVVAKFVGTAKFDRVYRGTDSAEHSCEIVK